MNELLENLKQTYLKRCGKHAAGKAVWHKISETFPPDINSLPRPSFIIADSVGDIGLSLLWIVESVLIKSLINDIINVQNDNNQFNILSSIESKQIGSLAHTEDTNNPVTFKVNNDTIVINGKKKYITGGINSDFILLTARLMGEEKISRLIYLPVYMTQENSLKELNLDYLQTVSHASLEMNSLTIPKKYMLSIDDSFIRKCIKRWSILERCMIIESCLGLLNFLNRNVILNNGNKIISQNALKELIDIQNNIIEKCILSANSGGYVKVETIDKNSFKMVVKPFNDYFTDSTNSIPDQFKMRYNDIDFLISMFMR